MKILLRDWAARNFFPAPHKNTLCTWVREGRISPAPSFIGRAYWCESDARYIADKHEAPKRPDRRRIVDKIAA